MQGKTIQKKNQNDQPQDKYFIVYALFVFIGIIHFLPGSFFVTAHDYWMYKFRNVSSEDVDSTHKTVLQTEFSPSVTISMQFAVVVSSISSALFGKKLNIQLRLGGSLFIVAALFVISAIFIHIDTNSWQTGFFVLTMFIVFGVHSMTTHLGVTFYSVLSKFPSDYLGPYLTGQGVAGIFTSCLQVLSLAVGISTTKSALVYFWMAIVLIIACLVLLIIVSRNNKFYRYYSSNNHEKAERKLMSFKDFLNSLKCTWKSLSIMLFYILCVDFLHPAITSLIVSEGDGNGQWNDIYFVPVTTFVLVSVGDYIGRVTTIKLKFLTKIDGIWFVALSASRIAIFLPLLMLCNVQPRSHLPVVFDRDYQYILIIVFFSISNGVLWSISNLIISKTVPSEKLEDAYHVNYVCGSLMAAAFSFIGFVSVDVL